MITKRKENGEGHDIVSYLVALTVKLHFFHTCTLKQNVLTLLILTLCRTRVSWYELSNSLALHRVSVAQGQSIGGARNPMVWVWLLMRTQNMFIFPCLLQDEKTSYVKETMVKKLWTTWSHFRETAYTLTGLWWKKETKMERNAQRLSFERLHSLWSIKPKIRTIFYSVNK